MSIVLAIPKFEGSKFGGIHNNILSLATYLSHKGHEAHVVDFNHPDALEFDFSRVLEEVKPTVVGVTSTSPSHLDACDLARRAKDYSSDVIVVKGGKHEAFAWETTLKNHPEIDISVIGEGELILEEIVAEANNGRDFSHVSGIAFRRDNDIVRNNHEKNVDFRELPFPDRNILPYHPHYDFGIFNDKMTAQVMTARGCGSRCKFCHVGGTYRERSVEQVMEELRGLKDSGYDAVYFDDGTFTFNRKRVISICDSLLKEDLDLEWGCQTRVDRVDKELLETMKAAGCTFVFYGVESADQDILDSLGKGIDPEKARRAVRLTRSLGIRTSISLMVGTPYENDEKLQKTFDFANELDTDFVSLSLYALYPPYIDAAHYEVRNNTDPVLMAFDEGYGSVHCIDPERAGEIYDNAVSVLGDKII